MSVYNIYFSPTGGTKRVADILISNISKDYINIDLCKEIDNISLSNNDLCLISVPSYGGRVPLTATKRINKIFANNTKAILNCVYGNREWEDTLTELQDTLENQGFICVAGVAAVAEHSIFRQFATGRPNNGDKNELIEFANKINDKLNSNLINKLDLPGNHNNYKELKKNTLIPKANDECILCKLCASECPSHAIDINNVKASDSDKCIGCMRCVFICPNHARDFNKEFMDDKASRMAPLLGGYKKNYLFL